MVVVLGETGRNFAAGMSSGIAYVLDTDNIFSSRCNRELVDMQRMEDEREIAALCAVIELHVHKTCSKHAESILNAWEQLHHSFWRILPHGTNASACNFERELIC
jgi:glutamate synthase domain-containing protein 3